VRYRSNLICPVDVEKFYVDEHGTSELFVYPRPDTMTHDAPSSRRFDPNCGFLTHDEAAILYHLGKTSRGSWIDIGSRLLWSTFHLRAAGNQVYAVDPEYKVDAFNDASRAAVKRARLAAPYGYKCESCGSEFINPSGSCPQCGAGSQCWAIRLQHAFEGPGFPVTSDEFFVLADEMKLGPFAGVMIDGNHDSPCPLNDARGAAHVICDNGLIVFHDVLGQPIRDGVTWLLKNGFRGRLYYTPRMMAVCWRGDDIAIPDHQPDPAIDWESVRFRIWRDGGSDMLRLLGVKLP
jgi:hypothetical protein